MNGHKVYLTKKVKSIFHPKVYYFRHEKSISILAGSANLTGGGLYTNFEASVLIHTQKDSKVERDFKLMIKLYSSNSTQITGDLQLSQYEREFLTYQKLHKKANKEFKEEIQNIQKIDLNLIEKYFMEYRSEIGIERFRKRVNDYNEIRKLLNRITTTKIISANNFLEHYEDITNSFYSSDLLRGKTIFAKGYRKIISAINFVKENKSKDANFVYSKARSLILPVQ